MTLPPVHFAAPSYLWALLAVPALALLHVWAEGRAQRRLALLISSPRLRAELTAAASAARRRWRYGMLLLALTSLALTAARPQLGFETEIAHRKGIDLLVMIDVSKSMLATDTPPNRLTRAKLAAQDLITHLEGDRAGLLAFAGSAFLQAPLTVDYDAVLTALADLDVNTIPLGGTNLEAAINLAIDAFGKAEGANRAIILMSDGETTAGEADDALKAAARANDAGIRIFTVGLGTPEGSLIPTGEPGSFIKDQDGKIVRTKLDEPGLDRLAKAAGGFYLRLQNGPAEMRTLAQDALGKMKAGEIDARATRKPIERYQWPLGAALLFLGIAGCINERRRQRAAAAAAKPRALAGAVALLLLLPGLARSADDQEPMTLYNQGKYNEAYKGFSDLAKQHAEERKLEFDAGASAYRSKKYEEAMDAFGHAMTSDNPNLQAQSHYNMGNTLYQHGLGAKDSPAKIKEWRNAIEHYNSTIKLAKSQADAPLEKDAVYNRDLVQRAIDEESKPRPTPTPTPPPSPTPTPDPKDQDKKKDQSKQDQSKQDQSKPQPSPDGSPSPSPENSPSPSGSPSPGEGKSGQPTPDDNGQEGSPSPSEDQGSPTPAPPRQRGDFKSQPGQTPPPPEGSPSPAPEPSEKKGEMSPAQARALLDSLKGEDDRPKLNEQQRRRDDPTIKDW